MPVSKLKDGTLNTSLITISKEQETELPATSVTTKVLVVVPIGKSLPLANPAVCCGV